MTQPKSHENKKNKKLRKSWGKHFWATRHKKRHFVVKCDHLKKYRGFSSVFRGPLGGILRHFA